MQSRMHTKNGIIVVQHVKVLSKEERICLAEEQGE